MKTKHQPTKCPRTPSQQAEYDRYMASLSGSPEARHNAAVIKLRATAGKTKSGQRLTRRQANQAIDAATKATPATTAAKLDAITTSGTASVVDHVKAVEGARRLSIDAEKERQTNERRQRELQRAKSAGGRVAFDRELNKAGKVLDSQAAQWDADADASEATATGKPVHSKPARPQRPKVSPQRAAAVSALAQYESLQGDERRAFWAANSALILKAIS